MNRPANWDQIKPLTLFRTWIAAAMPDPDIDQFCAAHPIFELRSRPIDFNPYMRQLASKNIHHWDVVLLRTDTSASFAFQFSKEGPPKDPTLAEVLHTLAEECRLVKACPTAQMFGRRHQLPGERKHHIKDTLWLYNWAKQHLKAMEELLGDRLLQELLNGPPAPQEAPQEAPHEEETPAPEETIVEPEAVPQEEPETAEEGCDEPGPEEIHGEPDEPVEEPAPEPEPDERQARDSVGGSDPFAVW